MAGTPCSRYCFCLSYLIPLDLILLRSATSRSIKMVGSVSILFCFVFFFFYPLGSTCHPYFGYLISTCYWTSGAPRFPLHFPVSVILMPNHIHFICQFSVAAVATALMATATGTIFSGPLHSCSSCCLFGFRFPCVPILGRFSWLSAAPSPQKVGWRSPDPPEKLPPWSRGHRVIPSL